MYRNRLPNSRLNNESNGLCYLVFDHKIILEKIYQPISIRDTMKKVQILAVACVSALSLNAQTASLSSTRECEKMINNEDFGGARKCLEAIITKEPTNSDAYFWMGESFYRDSTSEKAKENVAKATDYYNKGVAANPDFNWRAQIGVIKTMIDGKQNQQVISKAIDKAVRASRKRPYKEGHPDAYYLLADAYLYSKNPNVAEGIANAKRAKDIEPAVAKYWVKEGDAQRLGGFAGPAMSAYETAATIDKKEPDVYLKMGNIWGRAGQFKLAIAKLEEGLAVAPDYAPLYKAQIEFCMANKEYPRVTKLLEKYVTLAGNDYDARARYVKFLCYQAKAYDKAVEEAQKLLKDDPSRKNMYRWMAWANYENGKYDAALDASVQLFKALSGDDLAGYDYTYYARAAAQLGKLDTAVKAYNDYIKFDTTQTCSVLPEIANLYLKVKKYKEALATANTKLAKCGGNNSDYYAIMQIAYNADAPKELSEAADKYITKKPNDVDGYFYKAKALQQMDDETNPRYDAIAPYEKLIEVALKATDEKEKTRNNYFLSRAYSYSGYHAGSKGDLVKAKEFFQKAVGADPSNADAAKKVQELGGN
jgi:lipopolysaccharide biosynthesis regulator YciM